ncbi:hypothetical protein [Pseudonocardia sp. GCM10023141]|uniref:hypothetical protein n=1 Tax=Pseudonocardia sp. GCM10023141 TaxID=3252653 RepID=UPI00360608BF
MSAIRTGPAPSTGNSGGGQIMRAAIWIPGLAVALGAAAATMHGLYEVALASRVPAAIAWLYPLITDGLALVAYAATARLTGSSARYAWIVVILAAGLSGLAQASFLAADPVPSVPAEAVEAFATSPALRFGVGAWPAIAAAIVAHLLYLLLAGDHHTTDTHDTDQDGEQHITAASVRSAVQQPVQPSVHSTSPGAVPTRAERPAELTDRPALDRPALPSTPTPSAPSSPATPFSASPSGAARSAGSAGASPARGRAQAEAQRHQHEHGALPTVTQLMTLAEVSRGTAGEALKALREQPAPLHLVTEQPKTRTQP